MHSQSLCFLPHTCRKPTFATFTASEIKQNAALSAADARTAVTRLHLNPLKGNRSSGAPLLSHADDS